VSFGIEARNRSSGLSSNLCAPRPLPTSGDSRGRFCANFSKVSNFRLQVKANRRLLFRFPPWGSRSAKSQTATGKTPAFARAKRAEEVLPGQCNGLFSLGIPYRGPGCLLASGAQRTGLPFPAKGRTLMLTRPTRKLHCSFSACPRVAHATPGCKPQIHATATFREYQPTGFRASETSLWKAPKTVGIAHAKRAGRASCGLQGEFVRKSTLRSILRSR
jgi:hypothetical protein